MAKIHRTAIVDPEVRFGAEVLVGPSAIINGAVAIGDRTTIGPFALIDRNTVIGKDCRIDQGVVIGAPPLDKSYKGESSGVRIGDRNTIREYTTIHRATGKDNLTVVGDDNYIMAYIHIAHNGRIGNGCVIVNSCQLAGYVEVGDCANLGGMTGVHQFTRIGRLSMVGACSYLTQDLPPFFIGQGNPFRVLGVNLVGLRRHKFQAEKIKPIEAAYKLLYESKLGISEILQRMNETVPLTDEIKELIEFIRRSRRGVNIWKSEN